MECYPVKFECYDDVGDMVFSIECFDESTASINIKQVVTLESWDEITQKARLAIVAMGLK